MAINPLGNIILTNQNSTIASHVQQQNQHRIDFQNVMAAELMEDKNDEIQETRPAEETSAINPDSEHEKQHKKEEQEEEENLKESKKEPTKEPQPITKRLLDIKG